MSFIKVIVDHLYLFLLKSDKCAKNTCSRRSRFRAKQAKRIEAHKSVRKMAFGLNFTYDDKIGYQRTMVNSKIVSSRKKVPAAQNSVIEHLKEIGGEVWPQGFLNLCESVEQIELGTHVSMSMRTDGPISLDPTGKKMRLLSLQLHQAGNSWYCSR